MKRQNTLPVVAPTEQMQMAFGKLPEDLLMEILLRLPVKSLLQLKSVCKNWYADLGVSNVRVVSYRVIFSLHHHRAASIAANENTDCLLVKRFLDDGGVVLSFVPNESPVEDIDVSSTGLDVKHLKIFGPCNGVVCLFGFGPNSPLALCNPSMKEFRVLPQPSCKNDDMIFNVGFGYDPFIDAYKVVRFAMMSTDIHTSGIDETVELYVSSTASWRIVASPIEFGFHCFQRSYLSWNGDCFWYAYRFCNGGGSAIMAFRMTDEVFQPMPVPEVCLLVQHIETKLFVLKNSLAMVIYPDGWSNAPEEKHFDIWVMNEEDVEVVWTKKFTIGPFNSVEWALGFRLNGEFLMKSGYGQMMSYNLNTRERKEYQVHDQVLLYTESLVSVKRLY